MEVIGGPKFVLSLVLLCISFFPMVICIIASAATFSPVDYQLSFLWFQIFSGSTSCAVLAFVLLQVNVLKSIVKEIETVQTKVTHASHPGQDDPIQEVLERLKQTIRIMPLILPLAAGFNLLHIFVLPMFWYIVLIHAFNIGLGQLIFVTYQWSPLHRRQVKQRLCCGRNYLVTNTGKGESLHQLSFRKSTKLSKVVI
jgi:hypothetical protein